MSFHLFAGFRVTPSFPMVDGLMRAVGTGGIAFLLLGGTIPNVWAQSSADRYFHEAAQAYVAGEEAVARQRVDAGLDVAPTDSRLRALRETLRQDRERNEAEDDPAGPSDRRAPGPRAARNSEPSEGAGGSEEGQEPGSEGGSDPRSATGSGDGEQRRASRAADDQEQEGRVAQGMRGTPVDTLSRMQAERLLRALEGEERRVLRQLRVRSVERPMVEKDW